MARRKIAAPKSTALPRQTQNYTHPTASALVRPDVGTQAQCPPYNGLGFHDCWAFILRTAAGKT